MTPDAFFSQVQALFDAGVIDRPQIRQIVQRSLERLSPNELLTAECSSCGGMSEDCGLDGRGFTCLRCRYVAKFRSNGDSEEVANERVKSLFHP